MYSIITQLYSKLSGVRFKFAWVYADLEDVHENMLSLLKYLYSCPKENINGLTDKGQLQSLTGLKGSQEGTYLYVAQFLSIR